MLTQPPIRRSVMLLCFGAAGLLLAAEWRTLQSRSLEATPLETVRMNRLKMVLERSPIAGMVRQSQVVIHLKSRRLDLLEAGNIIKSYDIAIGQESWETPVGHFAVLDMRRNPIWQHPITKEAIATGPENPLGTRWIGFAHSDGYHIGIHGTNQEELLGQAVSHGCVRMRDEDIQMLFEELAIGTPITVRPD